ncbi:MAG: PilT/PilU family type 4a pilus ATPase [Actinomycetota bacterium]
MSGAEMLDELLAELVRQQGSDLHIKVGSPPKVRVNGDLRPVDGYRKLDPETTAAMAEVALPARVMPRFEEYHDADFSYSRTHIGRFRANVFRQRGSVAMVFRRVTDKPVQLGDLGLPDVIRDLSEEHRGLVLVTGPTGSGKTTTLAAMVDHINRSRDCHIVTIEDPIEILHPDERASINQREIGVDALTFGGALRGAMRQDPDVILVGEMRDQETVAAALSAAETGHLVFSTLHTIDAAETIHRIVDFFPPHQQSQIRHGLAGALRGTICQRLVPTADGEGRVAAMEVMVAHGRIAGAIADPELTATIPELIAEGTFYGMRTFDQHLAELVEERRITLTAAMAAASKSHDLKVVLQNKGIIDAAGNEIERPDPVGAGGRELLDQVLSMQRTD